MTTRTDSGTRKDPGSAIFLAMALIAVISTEAIYLEGFCKGQEELRKAKIGRASCRERVSSKV